MTNKEQKRISMDKIKSDPLLYAAYLAKEKQRHEKRMAKIKADPILYAKYLEQRKKINDKRMAKIKADPKAHEEYLNKAHDYYDKNKEQITEIKREKYAKDIQDPIKAAKIIEDNKINLSYFAGTAACRYSQILRVAKRDGVEVHILLSEYKEKHRTAISYYSGKPMADYFDNGDYRYGLDRFPDGGDYSWDNVVWSELHWNYLRTALGWTPEQLRLFLTPYRWYNMLTTATKRIKSIINFITNPNKTGLLRRNKV